MDVSPKERVFVQGKHINSKGSEPKRQLDLPTRRYEFKAGYEGCRFVLPGADIVRYRGDSGLSATDLAARYAFFTVTVPVQQAGLTCTPCSVVDQRLCLQGRQLSAEIRDMLHGHIFVHLFMRELLVRGPLGLRG